MSVLSYLALFVASFLAMQWYSRRRQLHDCPALKHVRTHATAAETPLALTLSEEKLRLASPELFGKAPMECEFCCQRHMPAVLRAVAQEHLTLGDSQPAMVMSVSPLRIAAYSDEFDAILVLSFPPTFVAPNLTAGSRLISVNSYGGSRQGNTNAPVRDIQPGPGDLHRWQNFSPLIASLVANESDVLERRIADIDEDSWQRLSELVQQHRPTHRDRDGRPMRHHQPGEPLTAS